MEIRLLNTFVTVAAFASFTQAAEQLSYAQSSVTAQIQALESELGVRLFERLGKSTTLTSEGAKLLDYAKKILELCREAKCAVAPAGVLRGSLCIGTPESLCTVRLLPLFTKFHSHYPDVELALKFGGNFQFPAMLRENIIDIALYIDREIASHELISRLNWPEPIILLASPGHALANMPAVLPKDLADQLLILTENGCSYRGRFLQLLSEAGITPKSTLESGNVEVMKQLAMSGMGISLLPRVAALPELRDGRLVELKWAGAAFGLMTQVVHHKDKWMSPAMSAFLTMAEELLSSQEETAEQSAT